MRVVSDPIAVTIERLARIQWECIAVVPDPVSIAVQRLIRIVRKRIRIVTEAIVGTAGTGAAIGAASGATASLLRSLFGSKPPRQTHMRFVDRCLQERGYEPMGWD